MLYKTYDKMTDQEKKSIIQKLYTDKKESLAVIAEKLSTYSNRIRRDAKKYVIS